MNDKEQSRFSKITKVVVFHTLKVKKQPLLSIEGAVFLLAQIERLFFRHRQQLLCMFNG